MQFWDLFILVLHTLALQYVNQLVKSNHEPQIDQHPYNPFAFFPKVDLTELIFVLTIITHIFAMFTIEVFPKMLQHILPSTNYLFFAIANHLLQMQLVLILLLQFSCFTFLYQILDLHFIAIPIKKDTMRLFLISTCPSTFLIIVFDTFRKSIMDNKPYIRFINTHPKRNSRYNHLHFIFHPLLLHFIPRIDSHRSMIISTFQSIVCAQFAANIFTIFYRAAINNPTYINYSFYLFLR